MAGPVEEQETAATVEARRRHRKSKLVLAGLEIQEVAAKTGLSKPTVSAVVNAEQNVLLSSVEKVARACGCTLAEFIGPDCAPADAGLVP